MGLFLRSAGRKDGTWQARESDAPDRKRQYPAVEVIPDTDNCCAASKAIAGRRLLREEAPTLPLKNCDQQICGCRYWHLNDRRTRARRDRDIGIGLMSEMFYKDCRRSRFSGRREQDV